MHVCACVCENARLRCDRACEKNAISHKLICPFNISQDVVKDGTKVFVGSRAALLASVQPPAPPSLTNSSGSNGSSVSSNSPGNCEIVGALVCGV